MKENYARNAANWWANIIQDSHPDIIIRELDTFKKLLTKKLRN